MNSLVNFSTLTASFAPTAPEFSIPEDNAKLVDEITRLAGQINAAEHRFLTLLTVLIEREAWSCGGAFKSPVHWLNYYCGIDLGAAREKVRVAKRLHELPAIDEAFRSGMISYSKVRAMTRVATPQNENYLLDIARHGTASHIEKLVRKYQRVKHLNQPQQEQAQYGQRELTWRYDEDGMLVIKARLAPEDGAVFLKAMDKVMDDMFKDVSAETSEQEEPEELKDPEPSFPQKRADALLLMAEQTLQADTERHKSLSSVDKHQVVIHLEADRLGSAKNVSAETFFHYRTAMECDHSQVRLSGETAKRLACDASLLTVMEDSDGNILNIGRKSRTVPPSIRRALSMRDQHCKFPGCCESRFVDAHHIKHWCDGGETSLDNLVLLCRRHHRLLHHAGYEVEKNDAGAVSFFRPDGSAMPNALIPQFENRAHTLELDPSIDAAIDANMARSRWRGEEMDYDLAVGVLVDIKKRKVATSF